MPSLRARIFRHLVRRVVGTKLRRAGNSVSAMRDLTDFLINSQAIPKGTGIRPIPIDERPAEWVWAPEARQDRAILHLHGGGFIMGSPASHRELAARLSAATRARVLLPDYRLAPEHPFPAAMEDAIAAYRLLLEAGHPADHLMIGGDSAGGGLALQALITLRDRGIPLPAAAILLSPITDWVRFDGESLASRAKVDPMVTPEMHRFTAGLYVGNNDRSHPLFSPTHMDLSGLPPVCIHVGDCEVMLSDSLSLARKVSAELEVWPGMWHVFPMAARFVPEGRRCLIRIGEFVAKHFD